MAAAAATASGSPDYGLDAPRIVRSMFSRGAWTLAFTLVLYLVNHSEYPGPAARMCGALALIGLFFVAVGAVMVWSSRVAKLRLRDRMLDSLALRGDERVLDVGCGRGLLAIGAAKRLKNGKVTGIDIWNPFDLSGNSPDAAKANAKQEGVADKVRIEKGDARKLVYPDNHYDVAVSSLVLHNIPEREDRAHARPGNTPRAEARRKARDLRSVPHRRVRRSAASRGREGRGAFEDQFSVVRAGAEPDRAQVTFFTWTLSARLRS